jgi:hypothetical protein
MNTLVSTISEYLNAIPLHQKEAYLKLRKSIQKTIPEGFM